MADVLKLPNKRQPQVGAALNMGLPFNAKARLVVIPASGNVVYDAVTNSVNSTVVVGIEQNTAVSGRAIKFNTGTAGSRIKLPNNPRRVTGFANSSAELHWWTRVHVVTPSTTGTTQLLSTSSQTTDGSVGSGLACRVETTGRLYLLHAGTLAMALTDNALPWVAGQDVCIVTVHNGTSFVAYANGIKYTCPSYSMATSAAHDGIWLGREDTDSTRFSGKLSLFADSTHLVSDAEGLALSLNPWQLFEPRRIMMPVTTAVGGGFVFNPLSGRGGAAAQPLRFY